MCGTLVGPMHFERLPRTIIDARVVRASRAASQSDVGPRNVSRHGHRGTPQAQRRHRRGRTHQLDATLPARCSLGALPSSRMLLVHRRAAAPSAIAIISAASSARARLAATTTRDRLADITHEVARQHVLQERRPCRRGIGIRHGIGGKSAADRLRSQRRRRHRPAPRRSVSMRTMRACGCGLRTMKASSHERQRRSAT